MNTVIAEPREFKYQIPLEFDYRIYVNHPENFDLAKFDEAKALAHYKRFGQAEGRICSKVKCRTDFIDLIPLDLPILEIGPFFSPAFKRPKANVFYLDCLPKEEMIKRAEAIKEAVVDNIPNIDYVWSGQSYSELIDRKFAAVYSSHNIEHQPCLVTHLRDLESILEEGGAVFFVVPDKRYCFDHFFPETTIADIAEAWACEKKIHRMKDVLEHRFFSAHNEPVRHWAGDHGVNRSAFPLDGAQATSFLKELERLKLSDKYTDVHAWKFTPSAFKTVLDNLFNLKLTKLRVARIYPTVKNSNEFYAVLQLQSQ